MRRRTGLEAGMEEVVSVSDSPQRIDRASAATDSSTRTSHPLYRLRTAGASETNVDRRERLRKLALETIDLAKDPYILRTHLGTLECRLCLTLHTNEGELDRS